MKRFPILALALLCAVAVSAQHKRRVLIEEFTNASCLPCATTNPAFNAVVDSNIQYLTPIKYQTNPFFGFDPMYVQTQTDVDPRVSYYQDFYEPIVRQNGALQVFPLSQMTAATIQTAYNMLTPVTMALTHALNATLDSVLINVSVTSVTALTGDLKLRVAVVEDQILFAAPPGTNGEQAFFQIMRKMLPNATGTTTGDFAAAVTKNFTFAWKLDHFYDLNKMSVAAFLQNDDTKEVYQSVRSEPLGLNIVDDGLDIASEKVTVCAVGYSPSFTLTNGGAAALTSAHFQYRVGTSNWSDLIWTGNLAPNASEDVTLTNIVINTSGTTNVEVGVLNSNLGVQTDLATTAIIKVIAAVGATQILPFSNTFQSTFFPPTDWYTDANDPLLPHYNWRRATNAGSDGPHSAVCSLFDIPQGQRSILITPKIDLSTATNATTLKFDHAYAFYNETFFDSLRIEISSNCGETWETIFHDGKIGLSTTAPWTQDGWVPNANEWFGNEIDISAYNGQPEVLIRFIAESGLGNNLYIDNVNVNTTVGTKELTLSAFNLVPNPTRDYAEVRFVLETAQKIELHVYSAEGVLVQSQLLGELTAGDNRVVLNASNLPSGSYRIVLQGSEGLAQTQWVVVK